MSEESTTPDLVELSRRAIEAVNRLDFDAVEGFYAPDAVYQAAEAVITFEGATAIRGCYEDAASSFEKVEFEAEEIRDLGNGVAFGVVILKGRPVGSSGQVRERWAAWAIWTDGLIERETTHSDIDVARAAAERLAEERAQADV